ncbi:MAG: hypothetical protein C5B51_19030 [Terriglobia bacterium]|nr:MAG: hypothetical protein C5B51_19030 [Terriglobia bacterium]
MSFLMRWIFLAFALVSSLAHAERLVFTMLTPPTCPVFASAPEQSKDFGFQSVLFRNDSDKVIQIVRLTVTFYTAKSRDREEVVDSGHVYMALDPGEQKRMDVFLGRIEALTQKVKSTGQEVAWVKLFISSTDFSDGTRWEESPLNHGVPEQPVKPF